MQPGSPQSEAGSDASGSFHKGLAHQIKQLHSGPFALAKVRHNQEPSVRGGLKVLWRAGAANDLHFALFPAGGQGG